MQIDYVGFLFKDNVAIEKHIIRMPAYGEKGWYKSVVSVDAFRTRELQRYYDTTQVQRKSMLGFHCSMYRLDDWIRDNTITAESMRKVVGIINYIHPYDQLPVTEHENLFDFYKHINYDYKKKRYI